MNTDNATHSQCSILHFGVGNFHRAHQAFYINELLQFTDQAHWGICGVGLMQSDQAIIQGLKDQNLTYTLTIYGRDNTSQCYDITSIRELYWALEDSESILAKIANPEIKIISLTITEGGYNIDKITQEFKLDEPSIQNDLQSPHSPVTIFGYIAEGLRRRKRNNIAGLTILSCDNLQHNGDVMKKALTAFVKEQDKELLHYIEDFISFPNSMVDRITPMTSQLDFERLNKGKSKIDKVPVYCEDYIQWVIEDKFIGERPQLEKVGVQFTSDVKDFENMKLSLLNASHSLLAYPSFLKGYRKVDQAMNDRDIYLLIKDFMDKDVTPHITIPVDTDLENYKKILLERFANSSVSDQVSRLCSDGLSKFPVYIVPTLKKMIAAKQNLERIALLIATYRHYLKVQKDDYGSPYEINEPWLSEKEKENIHADNILAFLMLPIFQDLNLTENTEFIDSYSKYVLLIEIKGMKSTLEEYTSRRSYQLLN
ncbi:mannitol dehydrogenase family protein [Chryseobacterium gleum]|uniref:mannitol dehydrogenase family protein n=1 Tax=Chryseobacterium gleum TaxID=250 RepID=UPI0028AE1624|nr:mannitol dehydrogenase family protein [Chryseobacterium gleum]